MLIEEVTREQMLRDTYSNRGRPNIWNEVVKRVVELSPGQIIAVDPGEKYHGENLKKASAALRSALRKHGIGREVRIRPSSNGDRLYVERCPDKEQE